MSVNEEIDALVKGNDVVLFMKGNQMFPQCGFSARAVAILQRCGVKFKDVDVLANNDIREGVKAYSNWPTVPQLYVRGEFIGGSDIMMELYQSGDLLKKLAPPA